MKEVSRRLNFSYTVSFPVNGIKWGGIINDLVAGGIGDIGVAHFFRTKTRSELCDPTPAVNMDYYCFLV